SQGFNGNVHYSPAGLGQATASWTFTGLTPGQYRVSATWTPSANRATNAPYTISDGGTTLATVTVDQTKAPASLTDLGATWQDLGGPYTVLGPTLTVRLSNAANGYVIADAIRLEYLGPLAAAPQAQLLDSGGSVPSGGAEPFGLTTDNAPLVR